MTRTIGRYTLLTVLGVAIGVGMQVAPHLPGQWGQNVLTYMASDFGCWAVITVVIATYAHSAVQSGGWCFTFMMAMVVGYYLMAPWDWGWYLLAVLMFPIGVVVYWYRDNHWVFILLELVMAGFLVQDASFFVMKVMNNQMAVRNDAGIVLFTPETAFSLGNYVLLILAIAFGMYFAYRCRHRRMAADRHRGAASRSDTEQPTGQL